jgi:hypothetical protein
MTGRTARRRMLRVQAGDGAAAGAGTDPRADLLAVEEPLEIRLNGSPLTVTMRTPGDDIDLAAGFLAAEGVAAGPGDIAGIRMCAENVADVTLAGDAAVAAAGLRRSFLTTSACGVCGKDSIAAIAVRARYDVAADPVRVSPPCWPRCPAGCARRSGFSRAPAGCTPPGCSPPRAPCWRCARTSAGTTRWTRSSAWRCATGTCRWRGGSSW